MPVAVGMSAHHEPRRSAAAGLFNWTFEMHYLWDNSVILWLHQDCHNLCYVPCVRCGRRYCAGDRRPRPGRHAAAGDVSAGQAPRRRGQPDGGSRPLAARETCRCRCRSASAHASGPRPPCTASHQQNSAVTSPQGHCNNQDEGAAASARRSSPFASCHNVCCDVFMFLNTCVELCQYASQAPTQLNVEPTSSNTKS